MRRKEISFPILSKRMKEIFLVRKYGIKFYAQIFAIVQYKRFCKFGKILIPYPDGHWSGNDSWKVFSFQFPFQYFWHRYFSHSSFLLGIVWRRGLVHCPILAQLWKQADRTKNRSSISCLLYDVYRGVAREMDVQ